MTHTPGPWMITNRQVIWAPNGKSADGTSGVSIGEIDGDIAMPQDAANARLIAAAPELLAALVRLTDSVSNDMNATRSVPILDALGAAKDAIAKAEGNSST